MAVSHMTLRSRSSKGQRSHKSFFGYCAHTIQPIFTNLGLVQVSITAPDAVTLSMPLRSRSLRCERHTSFWLMCPCHRTGSHQTWNSTCIEHGTSFSDLEVKVIPKFKGHFHYWLLCLYLRTDSYQTWNIICLEYGHSIHDLEVKVIPRSKVETENTFEWLAILF